MDKLRNHTLEVSTLHMKRKHRVNISTKTHLPEFRAIAGKSNYHNELTIVDNKGNTIVQLFDRELNGKKVDNAFELGKIVAKKLLDKKVQKVVFDRNGFKFIGRVKAMADGLIEGGIAI